MKAKTFIKTNIYDIVKSFDNISCAYKFDRICNTHYIKISPSDFFKNSDELAVLQTDIIDAFYSNYNNQSIVFLTDGSLIDISDPEYVISGKIYERSCSNVEWNFEYVNELLTDFAPQFKKSFLVEQEIHEIKRTPMVCEFSLEEIQQKENSPLFEGDCSTSANEELLDCSDYSLAA